MKKLLIFFQVAEIQGLSSRLEVQNSHLTSDLKQCERSRNETIADAARQLQVKQKGHDDQVGTTGAEHVHVLLCGIHFLLYYLEAALTCG